MKFYVQKKQKSSHSEQYGNGKVTKIITVYVIIDSQSPPEKKRAKLSILGLPHLGADFPYLKVACGEPRVVWRMSAPLSMYTKIRTVMNTNKFYTFAAFVIGMLFSSCAGNSKGNSNNEDGKGAIETEQQAMEPETSEKEIAIENIRKTFSRFSYSIFLREGDDDLKVYVDKDGYMIVKHISKSYSGTQTYFTLYDSRYVFVDGQQISYNPRMKSEDFSPFVMQEVLFILTKYWRPNNS